MHGMLPLWQREHGFPPEHPTLAFLHASQACGVLPLFMSFLASWGGRGGRIEGIATFPSGASDCTDGLAIAPM